MSRHTSPTWSRAALVTVDVQNDFTLPGAPAEIAGTAAIVPRVVELLAAFRAQQRPIVHVVRLYRADGSNADLFRREAIERGLRLVQPGSPGAELVAELRPPEAPPLEPELLLAGEFQRLGRAEWAMYKPRFGAFYQTRLEAFLRSRDVGTLVFCGCNYPNCPRTSLYEASERDFRLVVVPDAISGIYDRALSELKNIGATVLATREVVRAVYAMQEPV